MVAWLPSGFSYSSPETSRCLRACVCGSVGGGGVEERLNGLLCLRGVLPYRDHDQPPPPPRQAHPHHYQ